MKFVRGEIRQGDVALVRVDGNIPKGWVRSASGDRLVLAYGEVTGHCHAFTRLNRVALFRPDDMPIGGVVLVSEPAVLEHQEHSPLTLPPGLYIQAIQVEETPDAIRVVED
jgi:hypothetical protein